MKIQFDTQAQRDPERVKGLRVPYAAAKRGAAQWRWYLILLIVSSPLLYLLIKIILSYLIVTAPGFLSLEKVPINSTATGIIERIETPVGTQVVQGQVLVVLSDPALMERQIVLQSEYDGLLASRVETVPALEGISLDQEKPFLQEQYQLAMQMVTYQQGHLDKVRFLREQGSATIAELKQAEAAYHSAMYTLSRAENELVSYEARLNQRYQRPSLPEPDTPRVRRIEAELNALDAQLQRLDQRAPYAGRILDILAIEGQSVAPGAPFMVLGRTDKPGVIAYLDPKYTQYSREGRAVRIKFPDGTRLAAVVQEDAKLVRRLPADLAAPIGTRDLLLLVKIEFIDTVPAPNIAEGLPVMVRFEIEW
ncbi:MAG: hypothetical protein WBG37_05930 [Desulfobacterales bacterium]